MLNVPIDIQELELPPQERGKIPAAVEAPQPAPGPLEEFGRLRSEASRPVFIVGRVDGLPVRARRSVNSGTRPGRCWPRRR